MCNNINIYILFGCLYIVSVCHMEFWSCLVLDLDTVCGKVLSPALHATGLKFSPEAICNPNVIRNSELLIESPRLTCMAIIEELVISSPCPAFPYVETDCISLLGIMCPFL